jgi:hypothetical protein
MTDYRPESEIARLAVAVAAELGDGWSVDPATGMSHGCHLDGPEDVRLFVRDVDNVSLYPGRKLGKVEISGSYPQGADKIVYGVERHMIGVTGTRPADAIARDISRKLVPPVAAEMAKIRTRIAEFETNRAARHVVRDELAAMLPGARVGAENDYDTSSNIDHYPAEGDGYSRWRINHTGTQVSEVTIRSLPIDKGRRIAAILAE